MSVDLGEGWLLNKLAVIGAMNYPAMRLPFFEGLHVGGVDTRREKPRLFSFPANDPGRREKQWQPQYLHFNFLTLRSTHG